MRPLKVLMVIHTRWSRNLGGPRVQMELGEELSQLGCTVEKLSFEDLFSEPPRHADSRLGRVLQILRANRSFSRRRVEGQFIWERVVERCLAAHNGPSGT